jgi:pimeloyl-ACP methyl ester carboxylesterase
VPALSVDGDKLSYTDEGTGNPVIFVHGSCGGAAQWKALSGRLSADYRTICPDLFGNGRSEPWSMSRHWSPDDDRRAFEAIFDMLAESAHFVIHSIGAHAAYPTIRDHPDRIRSITFFEPAYFHLLRGIDPLISESEQLASRFRSSMEAGERERAMEGFIDTWAQPARAPLAPPAPAR